MDRASFYASLRNRSNTLFGTRLTAGQVDGMEGVLNAFASYGDGSRKTLAYALATVYGEVGRGMQPVREGFAKTDASARRAVEALARKRGPNSAVARYVQPQPPHGHVYYGRGYVQLTWKHNYAASSADAGVDLVANPDAVLDPEIGARILIKGLIDGRWNGAGKGIAHYLPPNGKDDLRNARRTVNVTDKWEKFAGFYQQFLTAIDAAGGVPVVGQPIAKTQAVKLDDGNAKQVSKVPTPIIAAIAALIAAIAAAFGGDAADIIQLLTGA